MMDLTISIEMCGKQVQVGKITGETNETACFSYCEGYLSSDKSRPVSISLPCRKNHLHRGKHGGFLKRFCRRALREKPLPGGFGLTREITCLYCGNWAESVSVP